MQILLTLLKNIKTFSIPLMIGAAISFGAGLYLHGKKVQSLETQIELLQAQAETEQVVRNIVDDASEQNVERRREISQSISDATEEIQEAKEEDEEVSNYLNDTIPERLRLARERARCVSLPYTCKSDSGE